VVTAAGQPELQSLAIAIVTVRALAIGRGTSRYLERLASHDAVLRLVTTLRANIFAWMIDRALAYRGDALTRVVSDVDSVQDLWVRVRLPAFASGCGWDRAIAGALVIDPYVG